MVESRSERQGTRAFRDYTSAAGEETDGCSGFVERDGERPVEYKVSFVDGSGSPAVLPAMWSRAQAVLDGAFAVSLEETAAAVRLLAERARVVAEGAGGLALAAALHHRWDEQVVCIVSGGNIDAAKLAQILAGETP